ncbi:protein of unknown function [Acidithiobacillus ferrivorans]|uniref:Uncharacterized protein n=1 Tax=Acidithiobacillus ferrivorans TaxID=160808 RepID=A0A060UVY9_9PROT|nr:hypothetical protein AFERRI_430035 [Acidithiobacillus ferrivorans]SMH67397.1 protein of unknown function [Acidithiobacillus ferrivorans]
MFWRGFSPLEDWVEGRCSRYVPFHWSGWMLFPLEWWRGYDQARSVLPIGKTALAFMLKESLT